MSIRDWCLEQIDYDEDLVFVDGFDAAILGVTFNNGHSVVVYDREHCVEILMLRDDMDREGAEEFFDFNVAGGHMGPNTPLFLIVPCDN